MIRKVNGDLTGKLVQHGDYNHSDELQQISRRFLKHIQSSVLRNTSHPFGRKIDSSSNSKNHLGVAAGAGVALLLRFPSPGLWGDIVVPLLQGWSRTSINSDRYSNYPTSATPDIRTPVQQDGSPTSDDSTLRTPNHLSDISRASFCLTTTASNAFFRSTKVASYPQRAHSPTAHKSICHESAQQHWRQTQGELSDCCWRNRAG